MRSRPRLEFGGGGRASIDGLAGIRHETYAVMILVHVFRTREEIGDHIFFPEFDTEEKDKEELYKETMFAKSICASCPLLKKCRDYGLQNRVYGIWGGMGYYERTQYWRKNKIIPKDVFI
jgi:hypothetical protein